MIKSTPNRPRFARTLIPVGSVYGRWTVTGEPSSKDGRVYPCICECGTLRQIAGGSLKCGHTKSCGSSQNKRVNNHPTKLGECETRMYGIWCKMNSRCKDLTDMDYGGRGIRVCSEWFTYIPFRDWALANGYDDNLTIDRKDPNGNYEPDNCRWITLAAQQGNRRNAVWITAFGETKTLKEWALDPRTRVSRQAIRNRLLDGGWTNEGLLTTPRDDAGGPNRKVRVKR